MVQHPWGTEALAGHRRAARHFGWRTRVDPTTEGDDLGRLLIHRDPAHLRRIAQALLDLRSRLDEDDDDPFPELDLLIEAGVHWFTQDWKDWDIERDAGALKGLGWARTVTEEEGGYRVTIRLLHAESDRQ